MIIILLLFGPGQAWSLSDHTPPKGVEQLGSGLLRNVFICSAVDECPSLH